MRLAGEQRSQLDDVLLDAYPASADLTVMLALRMNINLENIVSLGQNYAFITLGSVISISPLYSMDYNGLDADFAKPLSNDFNRLGGK